MCIAAEASYPQPVHLELPANYTDLTTVSTTKSMFAPPPACSTFCPSLLASFRLQPVPFTAPEGAREHLSLGTWLFSESCFSNFTPSKSPSPVLGPQGPAHSALTSYTLPLNYSAAATLPAPCTLQASSPKGFLWAFALTVPQSGMLIPTPLLPSLHLLGGFSPHCPLCRACPPTCSKTTAPHFLAPFLPCLSPNPDFHPQFHQIFCLSVVSILCLPSLGCQPCRDREFGLALLCLQQGL